MESLQGEASETDVGEVARVESSAVGGTDKVCPPVVQLTAEYLGSSFNRLVFFDIDMEAILAGKAIMEVAADRGEVNHDEVIKIQERVAKQGDTQSSKGQRLDSASEKWIQDLLEKVFLSELIEAATRSPGEKQENTRADALGKRRGLAEQALQHMQVFASSEMARPQATTVRLIWRDARTGEIREILAMRPDDISGTQGAIEVYHFQEYARRVYRVLSYASDGRLSLGCVFGDSVSPSGLALWDNELVRHPSKLLHFRQGDIMTSPSEVPGIELERTRPSTRGGVAESSSWIPSPLLLGVLPGALLDPEM